MFDRSAAVKLQLRDKKGKWIKMGSHVKWHSLEENTDVTGIARGEAGNNIIVEFKHSGQTYHINVPHNKIEVINEKASLDPAYVEKMGGHTNTPNIADHGVTVVHTVTHYGVASKNPNAPLTTKISDLKPGDVVYPIKNHDETTPSSIQKSPYNVKEPTTKANMQKFATSGHGVVKKIVKDKDTGLPKYAVITDKKGKDHYPSAQHYAIKQHDTLDQAILDGHSHESQAMGHETKSGLVDDVKGTHTTQDKFDASKAPVGSKVESTGINGTTIPLTKTGENEWTRDDNGVKLGDDVVDHMMGPAPEKSQDDPKHVYIDNKTAPESSPNAEAPIDISGWTKKPGSQMGSNAGGIYTDQNGKEWYVKLSQSDDHARSEVLADDLYKAAGVQTSNLKLADVGGGKLGTASEMMPGVKQDLSSHLNDPAYMAKIQDGFAVDALLANWDVAGLGYDNIVTDAHGNPVRVDPGGALLFRAQGQPKGDQFGNKVGEWESLRGQGSHSNAQATALFGKMTDQQLADSAKHVEALTPEKINSIVDAIGFDHKTATELKDKLAARREDIIAHAAKLSPAPAESPAVETPAENASPKEYSFADLTALPNGAMFSGPSGSLYKKNNKWFMTFEPNSNKDGMFVSTTTVQTALKNKPDFQPVGDTHIVKPMPDTPETNFYDTLPNSDKALLAEGVKYPYGFSATADPHHAFPGYNQAEKEQAADFISTSLDVNNALRGDATADHHFEIATLDQILDKSPLTADTTVYRGLNARDEIVNDLVNGGIYSDKGYTSTSTTDKIGHEWIAYSDENRTPVLMEIKLPAGFKAHKLDYNALGSHSFSNESEVVLPHGTKFKVTAKEEYTNTSGQSGWKVTMTPYLTEHNFDTGEQNDHTEGSPEGHGAGADSEQVHGNGGGDSEGHAGGDNVTGPADASPASSPQEEPAGQVAPQEPANHPDFEATYPDKGKDQIDANGKTIKVNDLISHPKKGVGKVFIGLPSTDSVKVVYPDGSKATHLSKAVTKVEGDAPTVAPLPSELKVGDHGIDPATHTAFIVGNNNSLIHVGDTVTHANGDKGVVKGIYKGEKTVKVEWADGHSSGPKKASTLESENKHVPAEPNAPQSEAPTAPQQSAPTPEPAHEGPAAPAPAATLDANAIASKDPADLTKEELASLPVGTTIKKGPGSLYYQEKIGENQWKLKAYNANQFTSGMTKSDENVLDAIKESGIYESINLPKHESAPTSGEELSKKDPAQLTPEDLAALPIGTTIHKDSGTSFYKKKIGENQWQMTKVSDGKPAFDFADSDQATHQALQNSGGAYKTINLPENTPKESAPAAPEAPHDASAPSMLHDPSTEDLAKLPDRTVLKDSNMPGYSFEKIDGYWVQHMPSGSTTDIEPHHLADGSNYSVQLPEASDHGTNAPASVPSVLKDPSIEDLHALPEGTVLTDPKLEGFTYTKQGDEWVGVGPNGYANHLPASSIADGATYHVQAPEGHNTVETSSAPDHVAEPDASGDGFKPMSTEELKNFPTGTKITTNHVMNGGYSQPYWIKQSDGTFKEYDVLTGHEETGHIYIPALMSNGFALKAELPAEANAPASDDLTGKPLLDVMHADKFSSLPIGSEIHSKNNSAYVYKKIGDGVWNRIADGVVLPNTYKDSDFTKLDDKAIGMYVLGKVGDQPVASSETTNTAQKLSDVIANGAFSDVPVDTELHFQAEGVGHFYKKTAPNTWQELNKADNAPTGYTHPDSVFTALPKAVTDQYNVTAPFGTTSTPDAGAASLTGVSTGNKISKELLDAQPAGTTMKKESAYGTSAFYYVKQSDGTWKLFKNGQETSDAPYTSDGINANTTATIGVPTPGSKFFYSKTGEIVYEGDQINYKGESGTISSITNTGLISVKLDGESKAKYKAASGLIKTPTYGKKDTPAFQPAATPDMATTPSAGNHTGGSETANFAGASGAAYDQQGVKMPSTTGDSHLSNGLTLAPVHEADTSNPLYGTPEPQPPVTPAAYPAFHAEEIELPKWDSAKWLEAVKARYDANPHKAKATLEESANWSKIQTVLNGDEMHLDSLVNSKYLDEDLKKEAIDGIVKQEFENKPLIAEHNAKVAEAKKQYDEAKAQHLAEYAAEKQEFTQKLDSWIAANPNQNAMKAIQLPETSKESFTGGTADWSKAHAGTFSAQTVFESIKKDDQLGTKGLSIATDSDQVEGLDANVMKILDTSGKPVMQVKMKLTGPYGAAFEKILKAQDGVTTSSGVYSNHLINDPATGLLKDHGKPPGGWSHSGTRYSWTDPSTGASVIFQRSSDQGLNVSAENNTVRIHMPENATPEDYQKVLENMGINAKPSSEGDIRVLAENQLMSMMGISSQDVKIYDGNKNHSGTERLKQLEAIEQKYGVTVDDMIFSSEANGRVRFFLKDEKAQALADKYSVKSFVHQVSDNYGTDTWLNMLTGPNNGLLSTYHRWNEGVGGTGMSSMSDHQYGSSDYIYTTPKSDLPTGGYSVVINPKAMFRRTDWWANTSDNYGQKGTGTTKSPYNILDQVVKSDGYHGGIHEALPKDSVPVSDWMYITMGSATRTEVLKGLKERGVLQINGIPIEDFILAPGANPPSAATPTIG